MAEEYISHNNGTTGYETVRVLRSIADILRGKNKVVINHVYDPFGKHSGTEVSVTENLR